MKLKELLLSYEFDEVYPSVITMYPNAKRHKKEFKNAYDILTEMRPTPSKGSIRYKIIEDQEHNASYFGAEDKDFKTSWDILLGMDIKKEGKVDLSQEEMLANCLLNAIFIGTHPREFDSDYNVLVRS